MPPLIAGVTLAVRKWGAGIGGLIGGFPWVAGPISFFIALEHGPAFAASTIPAALMGSIGTTLFVFVYAVLASRTTWFFAMVAGYAVFMVVAYLSLLYTPPLLGAAALNAGILSVVLYFFPKPKNSEVTPQIAAFDIPLRMVVATTFVIALTKAAEKLGTEWSGLLTPFPIMTSTLAVFTHIQQGSDATSRILYGMLLTGYGFIFFLLGVYWLVPILPIGRAYCLLVIGTVLINGLMVRLIR
jgi:hypothetical protein